MIGVWQRKPLCGCRWALCLPPTGVSLWTLRQWRPKGSPSGNIHVTDAQDFSHLTPRRLLAVWPLAGGIIGVVSFAASWLNYSHYSTTSLFCRNSTATFSPTTPWELIHSSSVIPLWLKLAYSFLTQPWIQACCWICALQSFPNLLFDFSYFFESVLNSGEK